MAREVQYVLTCDVHDGPSPSEVETVPFGIGGTRYEVDLCSEHAEEFQEFMDTYIGLGRKSGAKPRANTAQAPKDVRTWARENGLKVNATGQVPKAVREAYAAAH